MSRRRREREIKVQGTDSRGIVLWRDCPKIDIRGAGNQLALGMSPLSFFSASFTLLVQKASPTRCKAGKRRPSSEKNFRERRLHISGSTTDTRQGSWGSFRFQFSLQNATPCGKSTAHDPNPASAGVIHLFSTVVSSSKLQDWKVLIEPILQRPGQLPRVRRASQVPQSRCGSPTAKPYSGAR